MENYTITQSQILEIASEFAGYMVEKSGIEPIVFEDTDGTLRYTEEAQDEFNYNYDYYLGVIEYILKENNETND